ncbi:hypothetical protein HXX76_007659 [Chlamydomonas incerta]|uniref:RRM domain-containing protein n=1 Tax=Chlamydomonas incerta TaxID=51695 RepID=A0A835W2L5_CHLIN|nr:hypothetical protein HXX76_007659 [Chlamydomonas incerta]|eukprot:KAG2434774.1 hypothetical protein HXX76_007659 [Chlamydomonas incerta]
MELGVDADLDSLGADIASTSGHEPHPEPSRTLFVRHINPAASDEELLAMFKVFGDVRHMYTVSKHRGFIMVTYFDLRAAARAQAALHGAPITSLPLDIHFCAPKGDPTVSQGTVSLFNLDPDTSNDHLVWLFSKFGDVKDIRESPDRRSQKFITFYDTRHALAALRAMNKAEHLGKLPSNITPQLAASLSQMTMHDTSAGAEAGHLTTGKGHPSRASSQPGTTSPSPLPGTSPAAPAFMAAQGRTDMQLGPQVSPQVAAGLRSGMHVSDSASSMSGSVGGQAAATSQLLAAAAAASGRSPLGMAGPHGLHGPHGPHGHGPHGHAHMHKVVPSLATLSEAQALEDSTAGLYAAAAAAAAAGSMGSMLAGSGAGSGVGLDQSSGGSSAADVNATANMLMGLQLSAAAAGQVSVSPEQQLWALQQMAASGGAGQGQGPMWGAGGALYNQQAAQGAAAAAAANLQALRNLQELQARQQQQQQQLAMAANLATLQGQALSAAELNAAAAQLLHIAGLGQALGPAGGAGAPYGAAGGLGGLGALGGLGGGGLGGGGMGANAAAAQQLLQQAMAMGNVNALSALGNMQAAALAVGAGGRLGGSFGALAGLAAAHGHPGGPGAAGRDAAGSSRGGGRLSRRTTDPAAEMERKMQQEKLYALDAVKIRSGEDKRTTLMIKNIPNKYTQKMLLATIDEQFRGTYDFFYLPIDFKNKCNVGYAFINMINPFDIIALVERFNNRRWERFNSEKVCSISYARIQGRAALVAHFQNSSLMHEDKRCRPILFTANGTETTDPDAFQNDPSLQPPHGGGGAGGPVGAGSSSSSLPQHGGGGGIASSSMSGAGGSSASLGSVHSAAAAASSPPGPGTSLGGMSASSAAAAMAGPARIRAAAAAVAAASASGGMLVGMGGHGHAHGSQGQLGLDLLSGMGHPGAHGSGGSGS